MPAFIDQYDIMFKGLKTGVHQFSYELDGPFFGHFENPDYPDGEVSVSLLMEKKDHLLSLFFEFSGKAKVACDRCLDDLFVPVGSNTSLFVKFGEEPQNSDADVIYLDENDHKLNIAAYMFESICLSLPLRKIHQDDDHGNPQCNKEMVEKINRHMITDETGKSDPRWDTLKKLASKKN